MPGPFPGMDPFLESRSEWRDAHEGLITYIRDDLNRTLPRNYRAKIDEHVYVMPDRRPLVPDIAVLSRPAKFVRESTAVLESPDAPVHLSLPSDPEIRESFIEIVAVADMERPVTVIELLSPTNKTPGRGRDEYLAKQYVILQSSTHLVEIDLLRAGADTAAAPRGVFAEQPESAGYVVVLHRAGNGRNFEAWPWNVRERMPRIAIPLGPGEKDVVLDLQQIFDRNYDAGAYDRFLDYSKDPEPPLTGEDAEWMDALLREKGLRPHTD